MLHSVGERGAAPYLDEHRADGAGVLAGLVAYQLPQVQQITPHSAGVRRNRDLRVPSMNAANTNSAFVGQRR